MSMTKRPHEAVSCNGFYDYFAEMQNRSLVSEREFTRLVGWSVGQSVGRSLGHKLLFAFPLTNAQLDFTKRKLSSNGSANVKHS